MPDEGDQQESLGILLGFFGEIKNPRGLQGIHELFKVIPEEPESIRNCRITCSRSLRMDGFLFSTWIFVGCSVHHLGGSHRREGKGSQEGRQTCFFTAVNLSEKTTFMIPVDEGKPRKLPYKINWKRHQNAGYSGRHCRTPSYSTTRCQPIARSKL